MKLYLKAMNIPEKEIPEKMRQLIENVDYDLLRNMIRNGRQTAEHIEKQDKSQEDARDSQHSRESNAYFIEKILEKGKFQVGIAVHQMSRNSETRISMAHQGFEHLALIRNNTRGSWLELTIREVNGQSRIDGTRMWGHISSLKYEKQGQLYEAVIKDGGYSLAGLFSLWAAYQTDVFSGIAAASPSVWFPGFIEYMKEHEIKSETVYLSLGDREEKTRNSVMSQVGNCIRMGYESIMINSK